MRKIRLIALSAITTICFGLTGCNETNNKDKDVIVLEVYNCAEYISETDEAEGVVGVLDQFEQYCKDVLNKNVKVNYSTYETNEDLYNQIKAGGVQYDLVCPSDYMIQKMIMNDMLEPLTKSIENYKLYGSSYIKDVFDNIEVTNNITQQEQLFSQYAVPYMWGTMGFMYDPNNVTLEDVSTWDIVWDKNFKNQVSLKDSVRDTYIVASLHVYKNELNQAKLDLADNKTTAKQYNEIVTEIMNRCDDNTLKLIETSLKEAKENIYEFEVDTGKTNIMNGKYYVNLCWSGDAVYSLDMAEEDDFILNYKVPEEGSNVWFDGWVMPKGANVELSQELMNFLCDPEIAKQNMEAVGYTSAIAGTQMWELVNEWYGEEQSAETIAYDLTYFFKDSNVVDEDGNKVESFIIYTSEENRQLYAQYPDEQTIQRCAIMKDFGSQNDKVNEMWIRVKGNSVHWGIYVFLGSIVVLVLFFVIRTRVLKRARRNRNKNR